MYLSVLPACMYMHHKDAWCLWISKEAIGSSATLYFYFLKQALSMNLKITDLARLESQQTPNPMPGFYVVLENLLLGLYFSQ